LCLTAAAMWSASFRRKNAVKIVAEPNFVILFLNFCTKAKLQNLAADFEGNHERLPKPLALHIGVVRHWRFLSQYLTKLLQTHCAIGQTLSLVSFGLATACGA